MSHCFLLCKVKVVKPRKCGRGRFSGFKLVEHALNLKKIPRSQYARPFRLPMMPASVVLEMVHPEGSLEVDSSGI